MPLTTCFVFKKCQQPCQVSIAQLKNKIFSQMKYENPVESSITFLWNPQKSLHYPSYQEDPKLSWWWTLAHKDFTSTPQCSIRSSPDQMGALQDGEPPGAVLHTAIYGNISFLHKEMYIEIKKCNYDIVHCHKGHQKHRNRCKVVHLALQLL